MHRALPIKASRLIAKALSLVGHAERIRSEMQCSGEDFRDYCAGHRAPPQPELERLIELITREQEKSVAKVRALFAKTRGPGKSKS
jgi:hypothetical protein